MFGPADGDTIMVPIDLDSMSRIDPHTARCLFWQSEHDEPQPGVDPHFEKEAWVSRVLLEWGVCGQIAERFGMSIGTALYAPPRMVERAHTFAAGPVSADAVLLADFFVDPKLRLSTAAMDGVDGSKAVRSALLAAVVRDVRARGVHAVETFGRTDRESATQSDTAVSAHCGPENCMAEEAFLIEQGFKVVKFDPRFPRLRLEVDAGHQWQADVEHALDQLFLDAAVRAGTPSTGRVSVPAGRRTD